MFPFIPKYARTLRGHLFLKSPRPSLFSPQAVLSSKQRSLRTIRVILRTSFCRSIVQTGALGENTKENEYISDGNDLVSLHNDFFLTLESQIHSFRNIFFETNPPMLSIYSMDYMYSQNTSTT